MEQNTLVNRDSGDIDDLGDALLQGNQVSKDVQYYFVQRPHF